MLCARLGHADAHILLRVFTAYCMNMYGWELWIVAKARRVFNELCVAYYSCIKKLLNLPCWVRNHELCHSVNVLPCQMLVAKRQLSFWKRLVNSDNRIIISACHASGHDGPLFENHRRIRQEYRLLYLNLAETGASALHNIFWASLHRKVVERAERSTT